MRKVHEPILENQWPESGSRSPAQCKHIWLLGIHQRIHHRAASMSATYFEIALAAFILLLPFLYEFSQTFRYYAKFLTYYGLSMFFALLVLPVFVFRPKDVRNFVIGAFLCKRISPIIGVEWTLRGAEYLKQEEPFIIVCNHQSSLDILGMFEIWDVMKRCTVITKKEVFYVWPFGIAAWLCGIIFIDKKRSDKARGIIDEAAQIIQKLNCKLWIFAEGTRRSTGEIHPFKKGAFHTAIASQLPILPVVFTHYYFLDKDEKRFDHGKVIITTLPPISTRGMTMVDLDKLIETTREQMIAVFNETSKEARSDVQLKVGS